MAVFDDPVFALVHDQRWKGHRSGAQIVNRKDQGAKRPRALMLSARSLLLHIFAQSRCEKRSSAFLFIVSASFPQNFAQLDPINKVFVSTQKS